MYGEYKDQGLVVLGVHAWTGRDSRSDVEAFVRDLGVTYPVLMGGNEVHGELYKCKYVPRVFFIDKQGRIVSTKGGFDEGDTEKFEKSIKKLL